MYLKDAEWYFGHHEMLSSSINVSLSLNLKFPLPFNKIPHRFLSSSRRMQPISPYLFLCNIYSNIKFSSKRVPFKWSLSSNQHVSAFLFPAWVLHATYTLSHVDCRPWRDTRMIKNYKALVTYFSSVSFRSFSPKTSILLPCGFCYRYIFRLSLFSLPLCCYLMLYRDRKKFVTKCVSSFIPP